MTVAVAVLAAMRWRYAVITVHGPSMVPTLADGDRLLVRRCGVRQVRRGDLVVFREPGIIRPGQRAAWLTGAAQGLWVVKRAVAVAGDPVPDAVRAASGGAAVVPPRSIVVLGDGPESRDSRHWGFIAASHIFGVTVRRQGAPSHNRGARTSPAGLGETPLQAGAPLHH